MHSARTRRSGPSAHRDNHRTASVGEPVTTPLLPAHYRDRVAALWMTANPGERNVGSMTEDVGDVHANGIISIYPRVAYCKLQFVRYKFAKHRAVELS